MRLLSLIMRDPMKIQKLDNGNLLLIAEPNDNLDNSYWPAMGDLFEPYSTNGGYTHFDGGNGNPNVGLTSAPCIAESMDVEDDGECSILGDLWYFGDYMVRNDLEELKELGRVEYTLYQQ